MVLHSTRLLEIAAILFAFGFMIWPYSRIFAKAGYPRILGVLMVIPALNFIMAMFLAFNEWPVLKELDALRQRLPPPLP